MNLVGNNIGVYTFERSSHFVIESGGDLGRLRCSVNGVAKAAFALLAACILPSPLSLVSAIVAASILYNSCSHHEAGEIGRAQAYGRAVVSSAAACARESVSNAWNAFRGALPSF